MGGSPVWTECSATAMSLAVTAREGRLVLCAGAGVSKPTPTDLPLGDDVAILIAPRLRERGFGEAIQDCPEDKLLCIADLVQAIGGGRELLQQLLRECARWTTADPNFGHAALAFLTEEGLAELLTTNWDDCVERSGGGPLRLQAVVSDADIAEMAGPVVLKVHGCATRKGSLLVSTQDLHEPPAWAFHALGSRVGEGTVVFIGIGSIPDYVRVRIQQLLDRLPVGPGGRATYIVSRSISDEWTELIPDLQEDHRIAMRAADFLDELLRALVQDSFARGEELSREVMRPPAAGAARDVDRSGIEELRRSFEAGTSFEVLTWFRQAFIDWGVAPTLASGHGERLLIVLALLIAGHACEVAAGGVLRIDDVPHLALVSQNGPAYMVAGDAQRRAERLSRDGLLRMGEEVVAVSLGHVGPLTTPIDIVSTPSEMNIIDGPRAVRLTFRSAEVLLEEAFERSER